MCIYIYIYTKSISLVELVVYLKSIPLVVLRALSNLSNNSSNNKIVEDSVVSR